MNWIAWRTQRPQYLTAIGVAAVLALWLAASGVAADAKWSVLTQHGVDVVVWIFSGLIGLALGAPLIASEFEGKTERLSWTQSVTRTRWLAYKIAIGAAVVAVLVAVLLPLIHWWVDAVQSEPNITPKLFGITGTVGIGYALFAFSVGVLLGALIRNSGWAFAAGMPVIVVVRLLVDALRPTLVAPAYATGKGVNVVLGAQAHGWVLNYAYLPTGHLTPAPGQTWLGTWSAGGPSKVMRSCIGNAGGEGARYEAHITHCAAVAHLREVVQYQPESHFWALQGAETAIFIGMALVLIGTTFAVVRRLRL